jgi:hypothetical protein
LPSPAGVSAWATEVNSAGDVVGHIDTGPTTPPQLVLWPADVPQTYRVVTTGFAVGFDDSRRIIVADGRIISADGSVARISGSTNEITGITDRNELYGTVYRSADPFYFPTVWTCASA